MKKHLPVQILFTMMIALCLGGCSAATTTITGTSQPMDRLASKPPTATVMESPLPIHPSTIIPPSYPAPQQSATIATYPVTRSARPTITFTPTPVIHWDVDVIAVNWTDYYAMAQPGWISNTIAKLADVSSNFGGGTITLDISAGKDAKPVLSPISTDERVFSAKRTFAVECGYGMRMVRGSDNSLISVTALLPAIQFDVPCSRYLAWAADESSLAFMTADRNVYVWQSNGAEPRKIFGPLESNYIDISWSPDSRQLAFLKSVTPERIATAVIVDHDGRVLHEFRVLFGDAPTFIWKTPNVLASISRSETWYYDIQSGALLFSWVDIPWGNAIWHQAVQFSPDGRWTFIDQGDKLQQSVTEANHMYPIKTYTLYDIQTKSAHILLNRPGNFLWFAGWSADSSKIYVINRPAESISTRDPAMPFGLLAYDLHTGQVELLFKDAVQVNWNADKSLAFIVFAAQISPGNLGLNGGLWKFGSKTLIGERRISNQMMYRDPPSLYNGMVMIAWPNDGQMIAFCDKFGKVILMDIKGQERVLTSDMNLSDSDVHLRWSPDSKNLLVQQANRAWIVNVNW
jgi:hypothetical protein